MTTAENRSTGSGAAATAAYNGYNQRESDNLMNIVAVVYGVALTTALSRRPELLLHPLSALYLIPSMALLAAALLTALSFSSYVLAIGGNTPYRIAWTASSSGGAGVIRFLVDLTFAGIYVRLLYAATNVAAGWKPSLAGFVFAFIPVLAGAIIVRLLRRHTINWPALVAALIGLALWHWADSRMATRDFDILLAATLLAGVLVYGAFNHWLPYRSWKRTGSG